MGTRLGCTFVVEEAAIHQHEPALVPLLHPRAGLRERGGEEQHPPWGSQERAPSVAGAWVPACRASHSW